jgi:hypothetical protein
MDDLGSGSGGGDRGHSKRPREPFGNFTVPTATAASSSPPKRPRISAAAPPPPAWSNNGDAAMGDVDEAPAEPGAGLPLLPILRRVLYHVTAALPSASGSAGPGLLGAHMRSLRQHAVLRETCRAMRDAFDTHITSWDFAGLDSIGAHAVETALTRVLPRCTSLSSLALTPASTDRALVSAWQAYYVAAAAAGVTIRSLCFAGAAVYSEVPEIIAVLAGANLAALHVVTSSPGSTTTTSILSSVAQHCANVRALDVLLDGVDLRVLAGFSSLQVVRLLFRDGVSRDDMRRLTWALSQCGASLQSVDLRIHHLRSSRDALSQLASIPRLRKLSLFSCRPPATAWLSGCHFLQQLQLEWLDDLSDVMVEELSRLVGPRLTSLRIWNCGALTDYALLALAQACPQTVVDLKFERPQFSDRAVAALPKVYWEAWGQADGEGQQPVPPFQ